MIYYLPDP